MKKPPAPVAPPYPPRAIVTLRQPLPAASLRQQQAMPRAIPATASPRQPRRRKREIPEIILLIHAGWVGMALIVVAYIPVWKADFNRQQKQNAVSVSSVAPSQSLDLDRAVGDRQALFAGGSDSLVARTVGHAEGTRTPDGRKTRAYYGHKDPGNGVWNLGSFSFQHCKDALYNCSTPAQADDRQLRRLQQQDAALHRRATGVKLQMTLAEELNGIDLANQAPLAVLSDQGYADRLAQAKRKGLSGQDAILEARIWSFWNPQTNRWDAAGLGNAEVSIRHDQERRLLAIARALNVYHQQLAGLPNAQRSINWLQLQPEAVNPYSFNQERSRYLWWDAGYWDAKNQQRQVPPGYEPAYDAGFVKGSNS